MAYGPTLPCHLQEPWNGVKWQMSQAWLGEEERGKRGRAGRRWKGKRRKDQKRGDLDAEDLKEKPITA